MLQGGTAEVKVAPAGEPDIQPAAPAAIEQSIVIGSGVAALSAAIYLARAGRRPLVLAGDPAGEGGQLMLTAEVDNFPGFPEGVSGVELMRKLRQQAEKAGVRPHAHRANLVQLDPVPCHRAVTGQSYQLSV